LADERGRVQEQIQTAATRKSCVRGLRMRLSVFSVRARSNVSLMGGARSSWNGSDLQSAVLTLVRAASILVR